MFRRQRSARNVRPKSFRPAVEGLEERQLLSFTQFPLAPGSAPWGITTGADGHIWFTEESGKIGRVNADNSITEFQVPTDHSDPRGITTGPDGNIWFTEHTASRIGRVNPNGSITEFTTPTLQSFPEQITTGRDGHIWFTESPGRLGRVNADGTITEFQIPNFTGPEGITSGPDGHIWFTEWIGNKVGRINADGSITEFQVPTVESGPSGITTGPDGHIWFTEDLADKVARVNADGSISEFKVSAGDPEGITTGPDGHLWFTLSEYVTPGDALGRVNNDGSISVFNNTQGLILAEQITTGADGNLWFTEQNASGAAYVTKFTVPRRTIIPPVVFDPGGLVFTQGPGGGATSTPSTASTPVTELAANVDGVFAGRFSFGMQSVVDAVAAHAGGGKIRFNEFTIKKTSDQASPAF